MSDEEQRLKSIFDQAAEIASAPDRASFLDRACGGDIELRREVEALLEAFDKAGSFLEASPAIEMLSATAGVELVGPEAETGRTAASGGATVDASPSDETGSLRPLRPLLEGPGTLIGPYKLLQQIGEGGMGVVFMAEQTQPVRRKVALKVIKPGMDTAPGHRPVRGRAPGPGDDGPSQHRQGPRRRRHRHRPALLRHGAGQGRPDHRVLRPRPGSRPEERLELFMPVCQAIQHAHQKGIIHRDIKPSNVLVTLYDGKPVPKVIDFGVAKAIDQRLTEQTLFTAVRRDGRHARVHEPRAGRDELGWTSTRAATSTRWACCSTSC